VVRPPHHPGARLRKKTGEAEIGHHDYHAEQQGERVEVDRLVGLLERQRSAGDHQTGADQRHAGAINRHARHSADREGEITRREDRGRGDPSCVSPDRGARQERWRKATSQREQNDRARKNNAEHRRAAATLRWLFGLAGTGDGRKSLLDRKAGVDREV
jgi:hypothetical protein